MALRSIVETCTPRPDILRGGLTDAHFAAQLDRVVRDPDGYPVFGDPTEFFAVTYPTTGLKSLLRSTFGRLSGKAGEVKGAEHGVVRFQTSFGGGKTHGLIAAYHLAQGARPLNLGEFVDPDILPSTSRVAAVVGDSLGSEVSGFTFSTMWGAIAAQLGESAWERVGPKDASREAPDKEDWVAVFSDAPTLVIIDEIAAYLRILSSSGDPESRRLADAVPAFLFALFSAAAEVDTARVIITLATARDAFSKETARIESVLDEASEETRETESVVSRYREVERPAEDEEISEILRRRLFASVDESAAEEAAEAYARFYADLEQRELRVGLTADFADRMRHSYPFHPELVRVLDNRVGTIPDFQRTRGALRLLAEAVAALWAEGTDAPVINTGDLPLGCQPVAHALTASIGRETYGQVLVADVAGSGSHAAEVDRERFPAGRKYTTAAATTVFLHSLEQTAIRGATPLDVYRGTLRPGDDPDLVDEALRLLEQQAWHLYWDGSRYRFDTEPNPRKIIEDEKQAVMPTQVREEVERRIRAAFASHGAIKTKVFPSGPAEVDDRAELQLAVMHYDTVAVTSRDASPPPGILAEILDTYGVAGGNRTYRNGVVFLVADAEQVEAMREAVRWDLAAQRVRNDNQRVATFVDSIKDALVKIADEAGLNARISVTRCYRHLYYPKADRANSHLRHHELSQTRMGEQANPQTKVIQQVLEEVGKIRNTPIASDFLAKVAGFPATDPVSTAAAAEGFWRDHDSAIVLNPTLLTDAVTAGVRNGEWVYYDADSERAYTAESPPPSVRISSNTWLYSHDKAQEVGLLKRDPTWADVEQVLTESHGLVSGTELRARLEQLLGSEPQKQTVAEVLSRVLTQNPPPVVVVEGEPTSESRPLPRSSVERISLDRLTVLSRSRAETMGIQVTQTSRGFTISESGAAGPVFGALTDKLAEVGEGKKISKVEITKVTSGADTSQLRLVLSAVPMLPRHRFRVHLDGSGTFPGLEGDMKVSYLGGEATDFRRVEKDILELFDKASDLYATVTLTYEPDEPVDPDSSEWSDLADTFTQIRPGEIEVKVTGS